MTEWLDALIQPAPSSLHARSAVVPPKRQEIFFGQVVVALDAVVLTASFFAAYALRDRFPWYGSLLPLREQLWVLGLILGAWLGLARANGLTQSPAYFSMPSLLFTTARVHLLAALLVLSGLYLMRAVEVSRLFMQTFLAVSGAALIAERLIVRAVLGALARRDAADTRRVLVVGTSLAAGRLRQLLGSRPHWGSRVAGFVSYGTATGLSLTRAEVLGGAADVPTLLDTMVFDDVVVSEDVTDPRDVHRLAAACLQRGVTFHTLVAVPTSPRATYRTETLGDGLCLMSVESTPQSTVLLTVKRAVDVVGAVVGLVLCGVAFLVVAPLIRRESEGPVIFRQTRVGRNGRAFTLHKFRTMQLDAEEQKTALADANHMSGHLFKVHDDPRVTRIGRLLRRAYIDELPQFWNVLRGDMSLVGTRPPTPDEVAQYEPHHRRRLSMRPGITGLWQVQGNGRVTDFEEVVRLDCEYIDEWSLSLDVTVMLRTCVTVARCAGR